MNDVAQYAGLSIQDLLELYVQSLRKTSMLLDGVSARLRRKPILGGAFGGYVTASLVTTESGLDRVTYYVIEADSGFAVSIANSLGDAMGLARSFIAKHGPIRLQQEFFRHKQAVKDHDKAVDEERERHLHGLRAERMEQVKSEVKRVPRRRRQIFEESSGMCHYCQVPLTLDGKWHVEHKMPKALGGGNEPGNLVAACIPCNHKKLDKTDLEYIALREARKA